VSFKQTLEEAARLLPHQAILENFVHRNPLEVLQGMDFFAAQAHVKELLRRPSPGARLSSLVNSDPRKLANAALVELAATFLDRGAAKWTAPSPMRDRGFLCFFAELEQAILLPPIWRSQARAMARRVLAKFKSCDEPSANACADSLAEVIILENIHALVGPEADLESTLRALLFDMQGYAAMFQRMEHHPEEAPASHSCPSGRIRVRLMDFVAVHTILQRCSIEALASSSVCSNFFLYLYPLL